MEHHVKGLARITSHDMRKVRFENKTPEDSKNIIDGTLVEQFIDLEYKLQEKIVGNMLLNSAEMSQEYLIQVKNMVETLTHMH